MCRVVMGRSVCRPPESLVIPLATDLSTLPCRWNSCYLSVFEVVCFFPSLSLASLFYIIYLNVEVVMVVVVGGEGGGGGGGGGGWGGC